jgi:hypothetical protein
VITIAEILAAPPAEQITLIALARAEHVAPSTSWRWAMKGLDGFRLPTVLRGSTRVTTRAAFREWCELRTAAADKRLAPAEAETKQTVDEEIRARRAEIELARLGLDPDEYSMQRAEKEAADGAVRPDSQSQPGDHDDVRRHGNYTNTRK